MTDLRGGILITGGTGFIGGRLIERLMLEHDAPVRVLVRNPMTAVRLARFPVDIVVGDITDPEAVDRAVRGCSLVFHCAHDSTTARGHWSSAVDGTRLLAQSCLTHQVERLVHLSSFVVYGDTDDGDLTERTPWRSASGRYTKAKRAAEELLLALHHDVGLPVTVLQPTIVYGPFGEAWTRGVVDLLTTGLVPLIDGGTGYCNAVYVDDVVDAMLLAAADTRAIGQRYLVSAREPVTWERFFGAFETALGAPGTIRVPAEQLRALRGLERRRARREAGRLVTGVARDAIRRPETLRTILDLGSVRRALDLAMGVIPDERLRSLKARVRGGGVTTVQAGRPPRPKIHLPDQQQTALYTARTRVRIDKASSELGYEPRFDFDDGMALTTAYLRWARLV